MTTYFDPEKIKEIREKEIRLYEEMIEAEKAWKMAIPNTDDEKIKGDKYKHTGDEWNQLRRQYADILQ